MVRKTLSGDEDMTNVLKITLLAFSLMRVMGYCWLRRKWTVGLSCRTSRSLQRR
jgi:hypothetical protein